MKKYLSLVLILVMLVMSMASCAGTETTSANNETTAAPADSSSESKPEESSETSEDPYKIAVILAGVLGDKSYNDSAWEGIERAKSDFNVEVQVVESVNPADWEPNTIAMADAGYDMVICVSPEFEVIVTEHAPNFPDVKFVITDSRVPGDNVLSVVYAQNEGSFLAGAAAALFTQRTEIENVNEDKKIGWVGGMDIPALHDFQVGYIQGAKHIDPDTEVLVAFAGSFNDPLKGKELTLAQYSQGADIVMNVASNTGNGILEAANETGNYAVGVDINQDPIYPGRILTSMIKYVGVGTYEAIESAVNGKFEGNKTVKMDLANGGVDITDMATMKEALGDKFPQDIYDELQILKQQIIDGDIKVENYPGFE